MNKVYGQPLKDHSWTTSILEPRLLLVHRIIKIYTKIPSIKTKAIFQSNKGYGPLKGSGKGDRTVLSKLLRDLDGLVWNKQ